MAYLGNATIYLLGDATEKDEVYRALLEWATVETEEALYDAVRRLPPGEFFFEIHFRMQGQVIGNGYYELAEDSGADGELRFEYVKEYGACQGVHSFLVEYDPYWLTSMLQKSVHTERHSIPQKQSKDPDQSLASQLKKYTSRQGQMRVHPASAVGLLSGFRALDRLTGGFQAPELILLFGRTVGGKSSLALNIAAQVALRYGGRVGIFSLERKPDQLVHRLISIKTALPLQRVEAGLLVDEEWEQVRQAAATFSQATIRIDGTSRLTLPQVRTQARQWVKEHGIDLVVIDYLQLMSPSSQQKQKLHTQVVGEIARELHLLARELNIVILAVSQFLDGDEVPENTPTLLGQSADTILTLHPDEVDYPSMRWKGRTDVALTKHRSGQTGQITLNFDAPAARFWDPNEQDPTFAPKRFETETESPEREDGEPEQ